jgi:predicted transposase/invertase (TIGR01784 family)
MVKFRRFKEKDIINNSLHRWLTFFDKSTSKKILKEIIEMDTAIQKAQERIAFVKSSDEEFHAYQMREMAMCDYTSGINFARREGETKGRIEGKIEGRIEGKIEVARSMKQSGISTSQIVKCTGLTKAQINQLFVNDNSLKY